VQPGTYLTVFALVQLGDGVQAKGIRPFPCLIAVEILTLAATAARFLDSCRSAQWKLHKVNREVAIVLRQQANVLAPQHSTQKHGRWPAYIPWPTFACCWQMWG
jgi:hypothetical protein